MKYFDDIKVGDRIELGTHTFTAEAIKTFAAQYDPQAFHMDEEAAAKSHFGALCASGWHTVAAWMNLRVQYGKREDAERAARGEAIAKLGPSPGFRELKWLKPVYVGDTISYASEVVDKRKILVANPIKSLGAHQVTVKVHDEVEATVQLNVVPA